HQPALRAYRHPFPAGGGRPQARADHQPAGPAEVDPRDIAGLAGSARHLRRRALLHRSHRRPVHRGAGGGGEGLPAEVRHPQAPGVKLLWPQALIALAALPVLAALYFRRPLVRMPGIVAVRPSHWARHLPAALYAAAPVQPPTRERDELIAAIDRLQLDRHTAIGSGIIVALAALYPKDGIDVESFAPGARPRRNDARPAPPGSNANAAIILLTDGRRTIGPAPLEAAPLAADHGARVDTVGLG